MKKNHTSEATTPTTTQTAAKRRELQAAKEALCLFFFSPEGLDNIQDFTEIIRFMSRQMALPVNDRAMMGVHKLLDLVDIQSRIIANS